MAAISLDLEVETTINIKRKQFLTYETVYAQRHNIDTEIVRNNQRYQLAASLEWMIATKVMSVSEARRKYCEDYPEANRMPLPITRINGKGFKWQDERYASESVLEMIKPYDDSIREVKDLV